MTWTISFREAEADGPAVPLDWDTLQVGGDGLAFDWALAPRDGRADSGGLVSRAALATAIVLSLFTDARAPDGWRPEVVDRRGWWGDGLADEGTEPFGSWLWTVIDNGVADEATARAAEIEAERALAWLVRDRVAASVSVTAAVAPADARMSLAVTVAAVTGETLHDRTYDILWRQV